MAESRTLGEQYPKTHDPCVLYHHPELNEDAQRYAPWCQLVSAPAAPTVSRPALFFDYRGMWLCMPGYSTAFQPSDGDIQRRVRSRTPTDLVRACGMNLDGKRVLDACAGFGSDGLLLAQMGAHVSLIERHRLVWIMLEERAKHLSNAETLCADASSHLLGDGAKQEDPWDVILLDPMFPLTNKRALPNRGLQHLRELTESSQTDHDDLLPLLALSKQHCRGRVVLKRRLKDSLLDRPDFQIKAKSVRFDVYKGLARPQN